MITIKCVFHPKYKAIQAPTTCKYCSKIWDLLSYSAAIVKVPDTQKK